MIPPLALRLSNSTQQKLLYALLDSNWPSEVVKIGSLTELKQLTERRRFGLIYLKLKINAKNQLDWLSHQSDPVVGIINRKWSADQLEVFLEQGLEDYILKPFQPPKIKQQLNSRAVAIKSKDNYSPILSPPVGES